MRFRLTCLIVTPLLLAGGLALACKSGGDGGGGAEVTVQTEDDSGEDTGGGDDSSGGDTSDNNGGDDGGGNESGGGGDGGGDGGGATDGGNEGGEGEGGEGSGVGPGEASVTADGVTTLLMLVDCSLPEFFGPLAVTGTNPDEQAVLDVAGVTGAANIKFNRGEDEWTIAAAFVQIVSASFSWEGVAMKTGAQPPESDLAVEVEC